MPTQTNQKEHSGTMADDQIVAAKLPPVSSSSSLPSLASSRPSSASISELDTIPTNEAQTQPTIQGERMNPNTNSTGPNMQQQQQQYKRPFQSLTKLSTNGPYQKLQFHIIATILSVIHCLLSTTVSAATTNTNQYQYHLRRHLEDNNSGDNNNDGWTGEWNGEWTATDDMSFECDDDGGCKQTKPSGSDSNSSSNSMWYDNGDLLTPEQIITYVSLGALTFMTLLCCLCYPEIITGKSALVLFYHVHVCCVFNHGLGGVGRFVLT